MADVTILGHTVPAWEHLTGHEWEQVELLLADMPASRLRADLETLKIFVDSRTSETLDVDEVMQEPISRNELADAVEELLGPFTSAQRERELKRLSTPPSRQSMSQLRTLFQQAIVAADELLSATAGADSKRSSSTTTPDGDSKAGKRGRSKKRSN